MLITFGSAFTSTSFGEVDAELYESGTFDTAFGGVFAPGVIFIMAAFDASVPGLITTLNFPNVQPGRPSKVDNEYEPSLPMVVEPPPTPFAGINVMR